MIKTAGAQFNPSARGVYFLATSPSYFVSNQIDTIAKYGLFAVNELHNEKDVATIERFIDGGMVCLIDSGVFALAMEHARTHGLSHDEALRAPLREIDGFDELYQDYLRICKTLGEKSWGYIELDLGGRDQKRETRRQLEAEGLRPIPVYHPLNDGWEYFDELAENYDRICMGNIVNASRYVRMRLCATMWERKRKYPHLWVHHLGLSMSAMQVALPIDSCDSSGWLNPVRWAGSWKEKALGQNVGNLGREMIYNYNDPEFTYGHAVRLSAMQYQMTNENINAYLKRAHSQGFIDAPDHNLLHH